jgi:hypothetical protein
LACGHCICFQEHDLSQGLRPLYSTRAWLVITKRYHCWVSFLAWGHRIKQGAWLVLLDLRWLIKTLVQLRLVAWYLVSILVELFYWSGDIWQKLACTTTCLFVWEISTNYLAWWSVLGSFGLTIWSNYRNGLNVRVLIWWTGRTSGLSFCS